jgi:hypothetical protein
METVPKNVINASLYLKAKKEADEKYARPGLYKSAWIQKRYKELGGKYRGSKPGTDTGIQRWLTKEKWVEVIPWLDGKIVQCGTGDRNGVACRPLVKANDKTPITLPALVKIHGKKKLREIAKKKNENMNLRVNWKSGTISGA